MKIGLYGGTFDPPHNAHLALADWVQKKLELEYIYFIPAAIHACKSNAGLSPAPLRLKLVEKAIENKGRFRVSHIEIDRKDISYTVHTLQNFSKYEKLPDPDLYFIIGNDNLKDFHLWKDPEMILKLTKIVVIRRSAKDIEDVKSKYAQKVTFLESPIIDISASEIRENINRGHDVSELIPSSVLKLIDDYGLYREEK